MSAPVVGRLAPSPTGVLHFGNVRTFLWAWLSVRQAGGRLILRVEDLEKAAVGTVLPELLSDLHWLGLDWDEGPVWGAAEEERFRQSGQWEPLRERGPAGPYLQRSRAAVYRRVFADFERRGLIYPCVCSRSDYAHLASAPHDGEAEPRYPGTCRDRFGSWAEAQAWLDAQAPAAPGQRRLSQPVWRFRMPDQAVDFTDRVFGPQTFNVQSSVGDIVVFKTAELPTYQLAVAIDDAAMGVTEVVRGDDLLASSARQIQLLRALGAVVPVYAHAPLVVGEDGARLAKRHGDARLQAYRRQGLSPERLLGELVRWSGLAVKGDASAGDLVERWDWQRVNRQRVVLTSDRLAADEPSGWLFRPPA